MTDIDKDKSHLIDEAIGWLQNAKKYHAAWQHQLADDCTVKAKATLNNPTFSRQPIPGFSRNQQPQTIKVVAHHLPQGFMIIESKDFDPVTHQLYEEPKATGKRNG